MVTRASLATGYLVALGSGLAVLVTSGVLVAGDPGGVSAVPVPLGTSSVFLLAVAFVGSGVWLGRSSLSGESVWRVAQWGTLGLGVPTLLVVLFAAVRGEAPVVFGWRTVAVNNVAAGGIVGVLFGAVTELRRANRRSATLNQRNAVFNRVLRHDIRNSMNLVDGHAERIATAADADTDVDVDSDADADVERSVQVIREQVQHVVRLSRAARRLDELNADRPTRTVDLAAVVEERVAALREAHPHVEIQTDIDEARVRATDLVGSVVDDLVTNAVEHGDEVSRVRVSLDRDDAGRVDLRVCDDGPGIPADELDVHADAPETELSHSDGVGLWLSRWIVEAYGGDLTLANGEDGARVTVTFPTVEP